MSVPEFAGTLVTVFVGAFLAFFLENLRERRRLKEWLRQYLDQSATMLGHTETVFPQVATMLDDMQTQLDGWVAPSPTVPDWDVLNGVPVSRAPDLLGSLQGEALSVVRPGVLTSRSRSRRARAPSSSCPRDSSHFTTSTCCRSSSGSR